MGAGGAGPYARHLSSNATQIAYWAESAGARWRDAQEALDGALGPLGLMAIERAAPLPGEVVLDVGCGCGDTTLALSERVGPNGRVVGVDVSPPMIERAAERVAAVGRANVELRLADGQTAGFGEPADLVFSRFGVMFFADPAAAFANLRRALTPSGRLAFVCWQPLDRNPWMGLPLGLAERHLGPAEQPGPGEPGPFALADPDRIARTLAAAGFRQVEIDAHDHPLRLGADLDASLRFVAESVGLTATMLRGASPELRHLIVADIRAGLAEIPPGDGLHLDSAVWVVTARSTG